MPSPGEILIEMLKKLAPVLNEMRKDIAEIKAELQKLKTGKKGEAEDESGSIFD